MERKVPGFEDRDAMGCYPLFLCDDWRGLKEDLQDLRSELVSLALVTDPLGDYDIPCLQECFRDVVFPFKEHFVVDLYLPVKKTVSKHHQYYARKALERLHVERVQDPSQFLGQWTELFATLISRHNLVGIKAFSNVAFAKQLNIPGIVVFKATAEGTTVGAHLWFVSGDMAYSHLAAFSPLGYDLMCSYALYWYAIEYFSDGVRWIDIGAGAGTKSDSSDGLSRFKRGWSTGTRMAYFCGRIFDHEKYSGIVAQKGISANDYFPAYRKGEFA